MLLIGLHGKAGSGKDTAGDHLETEHGFVRLAFADKLKELAYDINPFFPCFMEDLQTLVDRYGWDRAKEMAEYNTLGEIVGYPVRHELEVLGVVMRETFGPEFWIEQVTHVVIDAYLEERPGVVITDVRFENELEFVRSFNHPYNVISHGKGPAEVWHLVGREKESSKASTHISNQPLEGVDYQIDNSGDKKYLAEQIDARIWYLKNGETGGQ